MNSTPVNDQQVIVKIDASDNNPSTSNQENANLASLYKEEKKGNDSMEFSFKTTSMEDPKPPLPDSMLMDKQDEQQQQMLPLDIEMGEDSHNINAHDHQTSILRHGSWLPPLYPDGKARQSDVQSSDFVNNGSKLTHMLSTHSNESHSTIRSKETHVSFLENVDHHKHNYGGRSSSDDDNDVGNNNDDDDDDDFGSSTYSGESHSHHDDEYGPSTLGKMTSGINAHRRKTKSSKGYNIYDHNDFLRCTSSNNSSPRKMNNAVTLNKTKSRLMDRPPSPLDQRAKSAVIHRSSQLNNNNMEDEEDDPFLEDDIPEEFKRAQISTLVILEWVCLVALTGCLICSLVIPVLKHKVFWDLELWKWDFFCLSLISGRLFSGWMIKVVVFFIERNFMLRKRVLYFVYGVKQSVQHCLWSGLVLLTWHCIFNKKVEHEANNEPLKVVTRLLVLGDIGAIIWLLKTLMVKVCASSFHVKTFFDRIQESLFNQFVIETLSAPPVFELKNHREDVERAMAEVQMFQNAGMNIPPELRESVLLSAKNERSKTFGHNSTPPNKSPMRQSLKYSGAMSKKYHDEGITINHLHKLNQNNVSAWNMKRLIKIVRHGLLTTLDERIEKTTATLKDEYAHQIQSEVEAKAAARKIFRNVAKPRCKFIYMDDLLRFMQEDEAIKTMNLFEGAPESGKISKSALKNWVIHAFRERRALALTLSDTKTAVNRLHKMLNVVVIIIIILIAAIWLDIIYSGTVVFLSSQLVVAAFVFGNTCRNVFESIIFLFVIHPFDVGDRCEIEGTQMIVEEMNILTTTFLRYDFQKIIYPNYVLLSIPIHNYYRSPDMGDAVEFCLLIATPPEKIAQVKQRIISYVVNKKEHWHPDPMVILKDAENLYMLRIAVWVTHRMNFQNMGERWERRALLVEECIKIFKELDVDYRSLAALNANSVNSMATLCFPGVTWGADPFSVQGSKEVTHH